MLHEAYPELHLKAWTPVEIDWFCRLTKKPVREVLEDMIDAGLGSLPGGGAEIFHPEVRNQICEHKADAHRWFEIHRTAHELGLRSNCTMLYGHIEEPYHRIDHLIRLRELQDETGGFQTFIPLAFHPENTGLAHIKKPSSLMDLRVMAVSRLMLDNVAAHQGLLDHSHMPVKNCEPDQTITGRLSTPSSDQTIRRVSLPIGIHSRKPGIKSG